MRILVLSKYDTLAASSRQRLLAYRPHLEARGIELYLSPLFDNRYLEEKFRTGRSSPRRVLFGYLKRLLALLQAKRFDLVFLQYEIFPYLPAGFEQLLAKWGVKYIVDYDDAIFHMYDDHKSELVRALLSEKISHVMSAAQGVIAGSEYLAEYARRFNKRVYVIPTVVDLDRHRVKEWNSSGTSPFTIGWIGSPSTAPYLELVRESLSTIGQESPARLVMIGGKIPKIRHLETVEYPWSEEREVDLLLTCDVGIMPLPDDKWARGKCAFKLIQYMACGLPTIASPVGENRRVVTNQTGILASSSKEWLDALRFLRDDPEARRELGRAGRQRCALEYSLQSQLERFEAVLIQANEGPPS